MSTMPNKDTPIANGNLLRYDSGVGEACQFIGSKDWFKWLEGNGNTKFYCDGYPHGYTARREKRRQKYYWYAYMKKNEILHKVYMGQSHKLTKEYIMHTIPVKLDEKYWATN